MKRFICAVTLCLGLSAGAQTNSFIGAPGDVAAAVDAALSAAIAKTNGTGVGTTRLENLQVTGTANLAATAVAAAVTNYFAHLATNAADARIAEFPTVYAAATLSNIVLEIDLPLKVPTNMEVAALSLTPTDSGASASLSWPGGLIFNEGDAVWVWDTNILFSSGAVSGRPVAALLLKTYTNAFTTPPSWVQVGHPQRWLTNSNGRFLSVNNGLVIHSNAAPYGLFSTGDDRSPMYVTPKRVPASDLPLFFAQPTNTAARCTAESIGGVRGSRTNWAFDFRGGKFTVYWSDGAAVYSKVIAP